jgi:hypothetical protein
MYNSTAGNIGPTAQETGVFATIITNHRVVSSSANRVNTTLTAARAASANVTATVGSTARMYVGMQLVMNSAGNPSEIVRCSLSAAQRSSMPTFQTPMPSAMPSRASASWATRL